MIGWQISKVDSPTSLPQSLLPHRAAATTTASGCFRHGILTDFLCTQSLSRVESPLRVLASRPLFQVWPRLRGFLQSAVRSSAESFYQARPLQACKKATIPDYNSERFISRSSNRRNTLGCGALSIVCAEARLLRSALREEA
jgi:hypothetical protein